MISLVSLIKTRMEVAEEDVGVSSPDDEDSASDDSDE
jgi:hypothetical protein